MLPDIVSSSAAAARWPSQASAGLVSQQRCVVHALIYGLLLSCNQAVPAHQLTSAPSHHPAAQLDVRPTHPRFLRFLSLLPALQANFQAMGAPEAAWRQKREDHHLEPQAQSSRFAHCRSFGYVVLICDLTNVMWVAVVRR